MVPSSIEFVAIDGSIFHLRLTEQEYESHDAFEQKSPFMPSDYFHCNMLLKSQMIQRFGEKVLQRLNESRSLLKVAIKRIIAITVIQGNSCHNFQLNLLRDHGYFSNGKSALAIFERNVAASQNNKPTNGSQATNIKPSCKLRKQQV